MLFTANPEDYTNRGSIITPLKDRIGSQIITHYPSTLETRSRSPSRRPICGEGSTSRSPTSSGK